MPRAYSTLLQNIFNQNPDFYATPTDGALELLAGAREKFTNSSEFKAAVDQDLALQSWRSFCRGGLQSYVNTLTDKQRANAAGVTLEGLKQLDAQQALADSFAKLAQASKPFVDYFTVLLNQITKFAGFITAAAAGIATYKAINAAIKLIDKVVL